MITTEVRVEEWETLSDDEKARYHVVATHGNLKRGDIVVLWYSPEDGEFYWQNDDGIGMLMSQGFAEQYKAIAALQSGSAKFTV